MIDKTKLENLGKACARIRLAQEAGYFPVENKAKMDGINMTLGALGLSIEEMSYWGAAFDRELKRLINARRTVEGEEWYQRMWSALIT